MFFVFRRPTTSCFQCFSCFVGRRWAVFCVFRISSTDDGHFSAISAFRSRAMNGFRHFLPVAASETLFLAIFEEKPQATVCFLRFSLVACKRNVIFGVFCISLTSDERFSGFLIFPRGGKCSLRRFSVFPSLGKPIFSVFHASQCWDDLFLSFFMLPKFGKADFQRFFIFPMLGNVIFSVFYLSEGLEMRFSAFFVFPRGWKCDFQRFLSFRGVRNAIFSIFHLSEGLEMRFSAFFVFPRGWKCDFWRFFIFPRGQKCDFWHFSSFQPLGSRKMLKPNSCYFRTATNVFSCENVVEVLVRIAL